MVIQLRVSYFTRDIPIVDNSGLVARDMYGVQQFASRAGILQLPVSTIC